jgi:hypothetical protein
MSDVSNNSGIRSDELDLLMLVRKIAQFIKDYVKLVIISGVAGLIVGIAIYISLPRSYSSRLILHSAVLTNPEQMEIISNWADLLGKGEYLSIARDFNCDPGIITKLNGLQGTEIQKNGGPNNPNGFILEVVVKDTGILDNLQRGIVYGLQNTEYIKAKVAVRRQNFTQLVEKVKAEIAKLDSTKKTIANSLNNVNAKTSRDAPFIIDVSAINMQMVVFNEKLVQYQEDLKFVDAIQVVKGFSKFNKPDRPGRMIILIGLIGGFVIGFIAALYKNLKKMLA